MQSVRISKDDIQRIRTLYEGVMANACHGLFFREGIILGREISDQAIVDKERYFGKAAELLKEYGWVESIEFGTEKATVKGSIEVGKADVPTCHRLRGILRELYERKSSTHLNCLEEECASNGKDACLFRIEVA